VQVSYFEIYNEKIHDLLVSSGNNASAGNTSKQVVSQKETIANSLTIGYFLTIFYFFQLRVREHPELGPYVEGLST